MIDNAPLVPAWEKKFQEEAIDRTVHYGTHIEGNELSFFEAKQVLDGAKIVARERDIQEVINYRNVVKFIDELGQKEGVYYFEDQLKKIHALTVHKLIDNDKAGDYRLTQVILRNSLTGEIAFRPPHSSEVMGLVKDFFLWLNDNEARRIHPIIRAAITHYALVAIHPFVEGNGRTARAFATMVLFCEGYDIKRFFSLEEYFDKDSASYFGHLMRVSNMASSLERRDLTTWVEYFSQALSIELIRIKEKVRKLSLDIKIKGRIGAQVALSERQIKLVEYLEEFKEITISEGRQVLPMVSDDTILRDLKDLVVKKIITKEGSTKSARYVLR